MPTKLLHNDASLISGQDHSINWKSRLILPSTSLTRPSHRPQAPSLMEGLPL